MLVATAVAHTIGIEAPDVLTGSSLRKLSVEALRHKVSTTHIFAEIEPIQKEVIILALHAADVGIWWIRP